MSTRTIVVAELIRLEENYAYGTFGVLRLDKEVFAVTLEPRDEQNAPGISSIPAQQYWCERYSSMRYPDTFLVRDVPGRELILFHAGNVVEDTAGCILLAECFGKLRGNRGILNSGVTFDRFLNRLDGVEVFHLTVKEDY